MKINYKKYPTPGMSNKGPEGNYWTAKKYR